MPARPAIYLIGLKRLQRPFRLLHHPLQIAEWNRSHKCGRGECARSRSLKPPHGMMPCRLDLEMKWGHVVNQTNFHKVVRVAARFRAMLACAMEDSLESIHCLQKGRHADVVK